MGGRDSEGLLPVQIGRYEILRELGAGGMGRVFLAQHLDTGWKRAIKTLQLEEGVSQGMVERFIREAQAATQMNHENVVKFYDFALDPDEGYYYIMEYLEGESLRTVLDRSGRLPWDETREILLQIARGLDHAHQHGIIHRDIKPENCMLIGSRSRATVKIIDFGIARFTHAPGASLTLTSAVIGTAPYLSPEQALQRPADERSDVYSLGALAYHLLTGETPFTGEAIEQVMAHVQTEPIPLRRRCPGADAPEDAERIVMKCLAKDPQERFTSMTALVAALTTTAGEALTRPWTPGPGRTRRSRPYATLAGIGALALTISGVVLLSWRGDSLMDSEGDPDKTTPPVQIARKGEVGRPVGDLPAGVPMTGAPGVGLSDPAVEAAGPELTTPPLSAALDRNNAVSPLHGEAKLMETKKPLDTKKVGRLKASCLDSDWRYVQRKIESGAKNSQLDLPTSFKVSYVQSGGKVEGDVEPRLRGTRYDEIVKHAFSGCEVRPGEPSSGTKVFSF